MKLKLKEPRQGFIPAHELYTRNEEIANSITHGLATGASVAGLVVLLMNARFLDNARELAGFGIFGASMFLLFLASTLYHSFQRPRVKRFFQVCDHSAVFLLIAGTYTPFMLWRSAQPSAWILLAAVWVIALAGIFYKIFFIDRYQRLSVLGYLFMGWLGVIAGRQILLSLPSQVLVWIAVGGLLYTLGLAFAGWRRLPYGHTIWHLFVIGGSLSHFIAVLKLAA